MKKSLEATSVSHMDVEGLGTLKPGMKVVHPHFGSGVVKALFVFTVTGQRSIGIEFATVGYKALVPEYAKLQLAG
jgi:hypothetical protein